MDLVTEIGKTGNYRPHKTWLPFLAECVWCGDNFRFYSLMGADGSPKRPIRYCSKRCIVEARWEGQKKTPSAAQLRLLYEQKQMSIPQIARHLHCATASVWRALKQAGILRREHTSVRLCKEPNCGKPVEKKLHWRRDKDGCRILFGTRCAEHRRAAATKWARKNRHEKDPLLGTRKTGSKPEPCPCPRCGRICAGTRLARACHNQPWDRVRDAKRAYLLKLSA